MPEYFQSDAMNLPFGDSFVDAVITDPPFSINFDGRSSAYNRKKENVESAYAEMDIQEIYPSVKEIYRILKPTGTFWLVMGWNNLRHWENAIELLHMNQIGRAHV